MKKLILFLIVIHASLNASPWALDTGSFLEVGGDLKMKIEKDNVLQFQIGKSTSYFQINLKPYAQVRNEIWFVTDSIEKKKVSGQKNIKSKKFLPKKKNMKKKLVLGNIESKEDKPLPAQLKSLDIANKYIFVVSYKKIQVIIFSKDNVYIQKHTFKKTP